MLYKKILCYPLGWGYVQYKEIFEELFERKYFLEAKIVTFVKRIKKYEKNYSHKSIKFDFLDRNQIKYNKSCDLNEIEKKYGIPNLNLISLNRYRDIDDSSQLKDYVLFWENYLGKYKPDLIFVSYPANISSIIFYLVAKKLKIKILLLNNVRMLDRAVIHDGGESIDALFDKWPGLEKKYDEIKKNGISRTQKEKYRNILIKLSEHKPVPHYMDKGKTLKSRILDTLYDFTFEKFKRSFLYRYRKTFLFKGTKHIPNSSYFFFPLHVEPEIALDLFAPFFRKQDCLIHYIHQSLPAGFKLVIKEHPAMVGLRPKSYLKNLANLDNVIVVNNAISSYRFLSDDYCKGVITITSTTGFEAFIFKKPVITFGNSFYSQAYDICTKITDLTKLPQALIDLKEWKYNEEKLLCFLHTLFDLSFEGFVGLNDRLKWILEKPNISKIADEIEKRHPSA